MFERFTRGARATVKGAVAQAERAVADSVTEEHLLLALLEQEGGRTSFAVTSLGLHDRRASLDAAFAEARRRGGLTRADIDALADIGIDIGAIVSRVEGAHGEERWQSAGEAAGGGRGTAPSPRARRPSWRTRYGSPWGAATASSARNICSWPSRRSPESSPTSSPSTARPTRRCGARCTAPTPTGARGTPRPGETGRRGGCPAFRTPTPVPPGPRRLRPSPRPPSSAAPRSAPSPRPGGGGPPRAGSPSPRDRGPRPGCRRGNGPAGGPGRVPGRP